MPLTPTLVCLCALKLIPLLARGARLRAGLLLLVDIDSLPFQHGQESL